MSYIPNRVCTEEPELTKRIYCWLDTGKSLEEMVREYCGDRYGDPAVLAKQIDKGIEDYYAARRRVDDGEDFSRLVMEPMQQLDKKERYKCYLGALASTARAFGKTMKENGIPADLPDMLRDFEAALKQGCDEAKLDENLQILESLMNEYSEQIGWLICRSSTSRQMQQVWKKGSVNWAMSEVNDARNCARAMAVTKMVMLQEEPHLRTAEALAYAAGGAGAGRAEIYSVLTSKDGCDKTAKTIKKIGKALFAIVFIGLSTVAIGAIGWYMLGEPNVLGWLISFVVAVLCYGMLEEDGRLFEGTSHLVDATVAGISNTWDTVAEWLDGEAIPKLCVLTQAFANFLFERVDGPLDEAIQRECAGETVPVATEAPVKTKNVQNYVTPNGVY